MHRNLIKPVLNLIAMLGLSGVMLYLLISFRLIDLELLRGAISFDNLGITLSALSLVAVTLFSVVRYFVLLRQLGVPVRLRQAADATVISSALGQWAPGALAVTEMVRMGLLMGSSKRVLTGYDSQVRPTGIRSRIALASVLDRVIGQAVMFLVGAACAFTMLATQAEVVRYPRLLGPLGFASLCGGLLLLALPFAARLPAVQRLLKLDIKGGDSPGRLMRYRIKALSVLMSMRNAMNEVTLSTFVRASVTSATLFLASSLSFYFASLALGRPISLLCILVALPLMAFSTLLPLGFAGFGGQQLVAIGMFSLFVVDPELVASASLMQSALALAVQTALGVLCAVLAAGKLRSLVRAKAG